MPLASSSPSRRPDQRGQPTQLLTAQGGVDPARAEPAAPGIFRAGLEVASAGAIDAMAHQINPK